MNPLHAALVGGVALILGFALGWDEGQIASVKATNAEQAAFGASHLCFDRPEPPRQLRCTIADTTTETMPAPTPHPNCVTYRTLLDRLTGRYHEKCN